MQKRLCKKINKNGSGKIEIENVIEQELIKIIMSKTLEITGEGPDLDKLEPAMSDVFKAVRKKVTNSIMESQDPAECICECGTKMVVINRPERTVIGLANYTIKRRTFYCDVCKKYARPLDQKIGKGRYSLEVKQAMILLGQRVPFEEASDYLEKLLKVSVSEQTIEAYVKHIGKAISATEKKTVVQMINHEGYIKQWTQPQPKPQSDSRLHLLKQSKKPETKKPEKKAGAAYMQLDGAMVHTREEGWKEVRNGLLFRAKDVVQTDKHHKKILKKQYFSVFNHKDSSLQQFKDRATQEAYDFGFHQYEQPAIVGDGAPWIWDYASQAHPTAIQILDYYHASEYLGNAFGSLKFENQDKDRDPKQKQRQQTKDLWFDWLWNGRINMIISVLLCQKQTKEVLNCIRYYKNNQDRMHYKRYRDLGLDIGSGAIESAHRIIVQCRMKQSGMHWKKKNVQSMVSLRAKYLSGGWEDIVENYLKAA